MNQLLDSIALSHNNVFTHTESMNLQQLCFIEEKLKPLGLRSSDLMLLASVWDDDAEAWRTFKAILEKSIKRPKANPGRRLEDKNDPMDDYRHMLSIRMANQIKVKTE